MNHPLVTALEHPFIAALQHAGLATQAAAQQLQRTAAVPQSRTDVAQLVEAMLLDQRGVAGRRDRRYLVTPGLDYRVTPAVPRHHWRHVELLTDALLGFPVADRCRIIEALAAGTGAALSEEGHHRAQAIEAALACGSGQSVPASVATPQG